VCNGVDSLSRTERVVWETVTMGVV